MRSSSFEPGPHPAQRAIRAARHAPSSCQESAGPTPAAGLRRGPTCTGRSWRGASSTARSSSAVSAIARRGGVAAAGDAQRPRGVPGCRAPPAGTAAARRCQSVVVDQVRLGGPAGELEQRPHRRPRHRRGADDAQTSASRRRVSNGTRPSARTVSAGSHAGPLRRRATTSNDGQVADVALRRQRRSTGSAPTRPRCSSSAPSGGRWRAATRSARVEIRLGHRAEVPQQRAEPQRRQRRRRPPTASPARRGRRGRPARRSCASSTSRR